MKKGKKLLLTIASLFLGSVILSGCTANFCEQCDKENILYALEYGTTEYYDKAEIDALYDGTEKLPSADGYFAVDYNTEIYVQYVIGEKSTPYIYSSNSSADSAGLRKPSEAFWHALDYILLKDCYEEAKNANYSVIEGTAFDKLTAKQIWKVNDDNDGLRGFMWKYGHIKFAGKDLFDNWTAYIEGIRTLCTASPTNSYDFGGITVYADDVPNTDYMNIYKNALKTAIEGSTYRACIATATGNYGSYGFKGATVEIRGKAWTDWKGLLEFLLIWPISAFIDVLVNGFASVGMSVSGGVPQFLAILIATVVIRGIMLLATFKSTQSQTKMTALQPEVTKIQNKYPNSKTNKYEQQKMAAEMSALYKKNKVNPLSAFVTLIVQFPVFICVWGAMQGSAYISTGSFLGLKLSQSISSALFSGDGWTAAGNYAAWTALVLFLLMAVAQTFSMLIPQWMQKRRAKKVSKLGVNPSANSQNNKMKWFTIIMLVMIIFMGFSLASGLGVYWLVGALISIAQTFITQAITDRNQEKNRRKKVVN